MEEIRLLSSVGTPLEVVVVPRFAVQPRVLIHDGRAYRRRNVFWGRSKEYRAEDSYAVDRSGFRLMDAGAAN